jgi:hypothetical protein
MNEKQLHVKAFDLRTKLFNLTNEIKALQLAATSDEDRDQLDGVACQLAAIHSDLPFVFVAAASEN